MAAPGASVSGFAAGSALRGLPLAVFVVGAHPVGDRAVHVDLDDPVGDRLDELVVLRGKEQVSGIVGESVVDRRDRLEVEVVGCLLYTSDAADEL